MKYLMQIWGPEPEGDWEPSPEEFQAMLAPWREYDRQVREAGAFIAGDALQSSETATVVRLGDGDRVLSDGPFAESKEQLGGYYVLDCKDLDEAIDWAGKIPARPGSSIEVRAVMDFGFNDTPEA